MSFVVGVQHAEEADTLAVSAAVNLQELMMLGAHLCLEFFSDIHQ